MKTMTTTLFALVALMSGCASMSASRGEFSASGITGDPIHATAVAGTVTTNQYRAETDRIVAVRMIDRGMAPGYGNGGYGVGGYGNGGFGANGDYWYNYRSRGIVPYVQQPAAPMVGTPSQTSTVVPQGGYATQQDLRRVEGQAVDSLCMHWRRREQEAGRPHDGPCPLQQK